jgi:hypothetical protein
MSHPKLIILTLLSTAMCSFAWAQKDSGVFKKQLKNFLPGLSLKKKDPATKSISFNGGVVNYNLSYRTNIDTPIVEKNILQHSATGNLNFGVYGIPVSVRYLLRRSNSQFFRDINDVQVTYDAALYKNSLRQALRKQLAEQGRKLYDTLLELDYRSKLDSFNKLFSLVNDPINLQHIFESREILNIPDPVGKDSMESSTIPKLKQRADSILNAWENSKNQLDSLRGKKDKLQAQYQHMKDNIARYKKFINQDRGNFDTRQLKDSLARFGNLDVKFPAAYNFFMNVRSVSLGRSQVNYSELTTKNTSITGLNFEYNSWYYLAVVAGTVDYRFRDFVVNRFNKTPQYMYMARVGVGRLEKNYFIMSAYRGRKQLFASSAAGVGSNAIDITGFAAEAKYAIGKTASLTAEIAQSLSPDFRKNPSTKQKFTISDNTNKALSIKFLAYYPKTNSRIEAAYKYSGANFQSFSNFQTNSAIRAWNVRVDQQLLNRRLRISAALKTNEFSNPYIVQNYKANTTFKSLQATYRAKKFPMISIGYVPVSQLTYLNNQLSESRFYSINGSASHTYKFSRATGTTTFTYSRFYNNQNDTSFAYYNARNYYFNQQLDFKTMLMSWAVSYNNSPGYNLTVLNGYISFPVRRLGKFGAGFKVSNFDNRFYKTAPYGSLQLNIKNIGIISAVFEQGYLPANNYRFLRSDMMNVNFTRIFR